MIWIWVAIAIVVVALIVLAVVALGTVRRLTSLETAANAPEVPMAVATLQGRIAELQRSAEDMQQRVQMTQERFEAIKTSQTAGGNS